VSCDGHYRFRRHSINGSPTDYIDWTASDAITTGPGATNRLGIGGYQGRFCLFINGQEVGEYWDTEYLVTFGTFALFTRASQTCELTGTFDDFAHWNIKYIPYDNFLARRSYSTKVKSTPRDPMKGLWVLIS
jgi:hypothetical protein